MNTPWIRSRDLAEYYSLGRSHSYNLAREFKAQASDRDVIKDQKILLIRKEAFEEFMRGRRK